MTETLTVPVEAARESLDDVVVRFAGDSGDGMQLTGARFTDTSALVGNDLATLPDFPAEIRAPQGTLPGVSSFQVRIADHDIHTPGDEPDVLVAMNPAALKVTLPDLRQGGVLIVNTDEFNERNLRKAGYETSPLDDGSLDAYRLVRIDLSTLNARALEDSALEYKERERCKNFLALGVVYWLFSRPLEPTLEWIGQKFQGRPELAEANRTVLQAGWNYADITGIFQVRYEVPPARLPAGMYRNIMGNQALALGLVTASRRSGLPLFLGSYPITPASDILHQVSSYKAYGVTTFQAEDEIAAVCSAIGAAFGGGLGVTTTSGPGLALKSEAINLAVMVELPLVVVDVQRGGPSTGLPTKTEQSDLLQALFGRNGESPVPVLAAAAPGDCFDTTLEACRIALRYMVPVILLSDGYIANGSEPWRLPRIEDLPDLRVEFHTATQDFAPYRRDPETLVRPWAIPGTPGLEHRIGGLEKADGSGNVSYDPANHQRMTELRAAKVAGIAREIPPSEVDRDGDAAPLLVIGWGSTQGAIRGAVGLARREGLRVDHLHLRYLNPLPPDLGAILARYEQVLVPELNTGQLAFVLRGRFLRPVEQLNKIQGRPFMRREVLEAIRRLAGGEGRDAS